jgi:hypothetical protein
MNRQHLPLYAIAAAILVVGLVALGVPATTLLSGALILACPLMMIFMMRGMHGGDDPASHPTHDNSPDNSSDDSRDDPPDRHQLTGR